MASAAPRIVMLTGVSPGIGKSTLAESLAAWIRDEGGSVDLIPEEAIFERPEFAEVGRGFTTRRWPTGEMMLDAYAALFERLSRDRAWGLLDWSCVDMIEDLPWAQPDRRVLAEHARQVRVLAEHLDPIALALEGDVEIAVRRAVAQRGEPWIDRWGGGIIPDEPVESAIARIVRSIQQEGSRRQEICQAFEAADWPLVRLDAMVPPDQVLQAAVRAVGLPPARTRRR